MFDEREVNWSHISVWTPSEVSKAFSCCERALPLRHREIHFVHLPWTMSLVFTFAKSLLSQKLRERFLTHSDFEHLWKVVPQNILPEECGGTIPMDDMIEKWVKELESKRPGNYWNVTPLLLEGSNFYFFTDLYFASALV